MPRLIDPSIRKLVEVEKRHKASFKDGERLHLWVGRGFKGALVLKAKLNDAIRRAAQQLESKMPNDYSGYDRSIETALQFGMGA